MKVRFERIVRACRAGACVLIISLVPAAAVAEGDGRGAYRGGTTEGTAAGGTATGGTAAGGNAASGGTAERGESARSDSGRGDGGARDRDRTQVSCGSTWRQPCPMMLNTRAGDKNQITDGAPVDGSSAVRTRGSSGKSDHAPLQRQRLAAPRPLDGLSKRMPSATRLDGTSVTRLDGNGRGMGKEATVRRPNTQMNENVVLRNPLPVRRPAKVQFSPSVPMSPKATEIAKAAATERLRLARPQMKQTATLSSPVASPQESSALVLSKNDGSFIRDCAHRDVAILASNARFVLTGGCQSVTVSGSNNKLLVEMAGGGELDVLRQSNSVAWAKVDTGPDPVILSAGKTNATVSLSADPQPSLSPSLSGSAKEEQSSLGSSTTNPDASANKSAVSEMAERTQPPMGNLMILSANKDKVLRDCANRDVAVSASSSDVVLTGGCRSVTVSGSDNKILAEIVGGGELTVLRSHNAVAWAKVGASADPVVVHAEASNRTIELTAKPLDRDGAEK